MSKGNNDIIYSAADIEKYHRGLLTPKEMHALEKAALDDPFLADALEGYGSGLASIPADIDDLHGRLMDRTKEEKGKIIPITKVKNSFSWWKFAAMFVIIAGAGWIVFQFGLNKNNEPEIAQAPPNKSSEARAIDTVTATAPPTVATDSANGSIGLTEQIKEKTVNEDSKNSISPKANKITSEIKSEPDNAAKAKSAPPAPLQLDPVPGLAIEKRQDLKKNQAAREDAGALNNQFKAKSFEQESIRARTSQARKAQLSDGYANNAEGLAYNRPNVFRGRVTDEHNNALPFSNITNTRDSIGTYADANGFFNLVSPDSVLNVRVSSLGFEPSVVELHNNIAANRIRLEEDRTSLLEVVISDKKPNSTRAQNNNMVLEEAEPADGWTNYDLYLANNLKEPEELKQKKEAAMHGEVELSFEVSKTGEPINITVKKSLCGACDKEAIRLIKEGPKWKRKARKGKTTVTIKF